MMMMTSEKEYNKCNGKRDNLPNDKCTLHLCICIHIYSLCLLLNILLVSLIKEKKKIIKREGKNFDNI